MKLTQRHSLTDIVAVKSGNSIRYVVAAMMAVAAVGGVNAEQIKLLDYKTGETFYIDDSEKDNYKYTYSFTLDELGFTYEFDCRYAQIRELEDGAGTVSIEPVGSRRAAFGIFTCSNTREMKELENLKGSIYKSVIHTVLETDYIELNPCKLAPRVSCCYSCGKPYEIKPFQGYHPAEIAEYDYYYGPHQTISAAYVNCNMLQYNYEEEIVRLYTHQKIRFDYSTEYYEMPESPTPPEEKQNAILFDYDSGEMIELDTERPEVSDEYKCRSSVTYDDAGCTFEYDAQYAMLYPIDNGKMYEVVPCGTENEAKVTVNDFAASAINLNPATSEVLENDKYKGVKYTIEEVDYVELLSFALLSNNHCRNCFSPYPVFPAKGVNPSIVTVTPFYYHESEQLITDYLAGKVHCAVMQYTEEKTLRLYKRLKIRFNYTADPCFEEQSGVAEVEADDGEAQYFNLQGMRVAQPRAGQLYIERRGNSGRLLFK